MLKAHARRSCRPTHAPENVLIEIRLVAFGRFCQTWICLPNKYYFFFGELISLFGRGQETFFVFFRIPFYPLFAVLTMIETLRYLNVKRKQFGAMNANFCGKSLKRKKSVSCTFELTRLPFMTDDEWKAQYLLWATHCHRVNHCDESAQREQMKNHLMLIV